MPWAGFGGMGSAWIFNDETNLSGSALPRKLRPFMPIRIDAGKHGDERFVMYDGDQPLGAVSYWATDKDAEDVLSHTILGYARHVNATKAVAPV